MKLISTKDYKAQGVKVLVYGDTGVGKTVLCSTAPTPIILSAESGLLSLADVDIPVIEINSMKTLVEAYQWVTQSKEGKQFKSICIDSLSDLAEVCLGEHKASTRDGRAAYGGMADDVADAIRKFRDIKGMNVVFTAKNKRIVEESTGKTTYLPSCPGQTLLQNLPYFFDECFAMRIGKQPKVGPYRYLQTQPDHSWTAKDRSGKLDAQEKPELTYIFNKIIGNAKQTNKE